MKGIVDDVAGLKLRSEKRVGDIDNSVNEKRDIDVSADKHFERNVDNNDQMNFECIKRLEQRIDGLEDHSRRDNLLFYGFPEQSNENCTTSAKNLIYSKILNDDYENDIKFVRAHRLGRYNPNADKPRAIIVKFREFNERMDVFMSKKKLKGIPYAVTEDFSTNTNNEREFLEDCIKTAKLGLKGEMEAGFARYKTLIIKNSNGKFNRFSAHYINQHPWDWWMRARVTNADEWRSQEDVQKNRALQEFRQALVGDVPPADEEIRDDSDISNSQPLSDPNLPKEDRNSDPATTEETTEPATDNPVEVVVDGASG